MRETVDSLFVTDVPLEAKAGFKAVSVSRKDTAATDKTESKSEHDANSKEPEKKEQNVKTNRELLVVDEDVEDKEKCDETSAKETTMRR